MSLAPSVRPIGFYGRITTVMLLSVSAVSIYARFSGDYGTEATISELLTSRIM